VSRVEVRPAEPEDIDGVWPLVQEFSFSYRPDRSAYVRSFGELLDRRDTLVLVAAADGVVVGYLLGSCHGTFFANGPVAWIEELMVDESVRHQGIATRLMASAEMWARSIPAAYVALASRRAGGFYLELGYEESAAYFRKAFVSPAN
jgi:GNAT superfamily N-acetyltransferase